MLNRTFLTAFLLTALVAMVPRMARADGAPSLISIQDSVAWRMTLQPSQDGCKCRVYDQEPKYNALNNITTREKAELKAESPTFTLDGRTGSYWIVLFPNSRAVDVKLAFFRGNGREPEGTLAIQGSYSLGKWWSGPTFQLSCPNRGVVCIGANFGLGAGKDTSNLNFIALHPPYESMGTQGSKAPSAAPQGLSDEEKTIRAWEIKKRQEKGILTADPLGSDTDDSPFGEARPANARDYWRLNLSSSPKPTPEAVRSSYKKFSLMYHPDKNGSSAEAKAVFQRLTTAYTRVLKVAESN